MLANALTAEIRRAGHHAVLVEVPFTSWPPSVLPKQIAIDEGVDLSDADRVIAIKFPAYFVPHHDPVVWLLHQHRAAYELFGTDHGLPDTPVGRELRDHLVAADNRVLGDGRRIFASSPVTQARLKKFNGIDSEVLIHPINDAELLTGGDSDGYIFAGGRVTPLKRQLLLVEALRYASRDTRLVIAGPPEGGYDDELRRHAEKWQVEEMVSFQFGFWPREQIADWMNHAAACAYVPLHEDSMGYFAMEAAQANKPVVTSSDSGGVLDLVRDGETGWVAAPTAEALGAAMSSAMAEPARTRELGVAQGERWRQMDITWASTVERLLA
jgi:glycosyltransferase involved in cell wall biosynthesis